MNSEPKKVHRGHFMVYEEAVRRIFANLDEPAAVRNALLVYVTLCRKQNLKRTSTFEDRIAGIAADSSMSYRLAQDAIDFLESLHLVRVKRRKVAGTKGKAPSIYTVLSPFFDEQASGKNGGTFRQKDGTSSADHVQANSAQLLQEHTNNSSKLSLSSPIPPPTFERENTCWDTVITKLASEHGVSPQQVADARKAHAKRLSRLPSGAYQTPENFTRALPSLLASVKGPAAKPATTDLVQEKEGHRSRWWKQWRMESGGGANDSWDTASEEDRLTFAFSKYGDYFRTEAERDDRVRIDENGGILIAPK
jgi:hypothetical protein